MRLARIFNRAGSIERPLRLARPRAQLKQGRQDWYRITNKAANSAELYIYDEIGYWGISASDLVNELKSLDVSTIELRINSPGGEVFDGMAIFNALKGHKATVNVTIDGLAASAASFIAMSGDHITMNRGSQMMIHDGMALVAGNAAEMREMADMLDRTSDSIAALYAEAAGARGQSSSVSHWRDQMRAESWYGPAEAVKAGLADEMAGPDASATPANTWDLSIFPNWPGTLTPPRESVPANVAQVPADDPHVELSVPEPTPEPVVPFDPAAFRAGAASFGESLKTPVLPAGFADMFKGAITLVTNDTPDQPDVEPTAPEPVPDFLPAFDPHAFAQSLREARVNVTA